MVYIFKTDIFNSSEAEIIKSSLSELFDEVMVTFDLDDCDRIMRIETKIPDRRRLINFLHSLQFEIEELYY